MGTKVRNLRITQTKQALINAFISLVNEKDFEKITIADLTEVAKVNRATFYAHFNDKYELLDYIVIESASYLVEKNTSGVVKFDRESIHQLFYAVCDYHEQPNIQCRRSYLSLIPMLKEKMLTELKKYLFNSLADKLTDLDKSLYVPLYANIIVEAGYLFATNELSYDKETTAKKVSSLIVNE